MRRAADESLSLFVILVLSSQAFNLQLLSLGTEHFVTGTSNFSLSSVILSLVEE
jgi:hypothetical protein